MSNNENTLDGIHICTMTLTGEISGYVTPVEEYKRVFCNYLPAAKKKEGSRREFANQYTVCIPISTGSVLNCKIFHSNGKVQICGAKNFSDSMEFKDQLSRISGMQAGHFKIVMVNASLSLGKQVLMYPFAAHLQSWHLPTKFDTLRHPGIQFAYMYNRRNPLLNGLCSCSREDIRCDGDDDMDRDILVSAPKNLPKKRSVHGVCSCHRVTVIVFQSGSVVITGANAIAQIIEIAQFVKQHASRYFDHNAPETRTRPRRTRGASHAGVLRAEPGSTRGRGGRRGRRGKNKKVA